MKKKAIEKNNLKFLPLSVKNTPTNHPTLPPRPSFSDSTSSSDNQDLVNIDKTPYSAILLPKPSHADKTN